MRNHSFSDYIRFPKHLVCARVCVCQREYKWLKRKTDRGFPLCRTFALIFAALGLSISTYSALNFYTAAVFLRFIIDTSYIEHDNVKRYAILFSMHILYVHIF